MTLKNNIAQFLVRIGVSANFLTAAGLGVAALSGFFALRGQFIYAGVFLLLSGALDMLDGAVAREAKTDKPFGGILDSTLDRYGDVFVLGGVLFYCVGAGRILFAALALSAIIGSFVISYVRARAECEIDSCRTGFWERGERMGYLILGLALNNISLTVAVLAVGTQWTVLQRLLYAHNKNKYPFLFSTGRTRFRYYIKLILLLLAALFIKLN